MITYGWIAAGGALGTVARFALQSFVQAWLPRWTPAGTLNFPAGTLAVNWLGCFAIGLLGAFFVVTPLRDEHRLALTVGVLGGFTTFSAFSYETIELAAARQVPLAGVYLFLSCAGGLAAVWCGQRVGQCCP